MKYELGFVIPDLLEYVTKNNLHVFNINIRLRSIYENENINILFL